MASPDLIFNTAKELSGTTSSLPSVYASVDPQATGLEPVVEDQEEIPVVDFALLTQGTPDQRSKAVQDLGKACQEWGFFLLVNHGIPERMRQEMMEKINAFFNLSAEEKAEYADTHVMNPIRYGTSFNPNVDDTMYWRDYLKINMHPEFHYLSKPPGCRELLHVYSTSVRDIAMKLLGGIWESLGLKESDMKEALQLDSCFQNIVCNLYPPCPQPELAAGLPPHSDHGLLTFLFQNGIDGLEVKHKGRWVRVKPLPNSYIINTGDHMEIVSNGKYQSVLHRASLNGKSARLSIVSLISAALETVVVPAPQLVSSVRPAAFRGMKFKEFMEYQQSHKLREKSVLDLLRI